MTPSHKVPFTNRSTVTRSLPGISSSTAESMAAYSQPIPTPVKKRKNEKLKSPQCLWKRNRLVPIRTSFGDLDDGLGWIGGSTAEG